VPARAADRGRKCPSAPDRRPRPRSAVRAWTSRLASCWLISVGAVWGGQEVRQAGDFLLPRLDVEACSRKDRTIERRYGMANAPCKGHTIAIVLVPLAVFRSRFMTLSPATDGEKVDNPADPLARAPLHGGCRGVVRFALAGRPLDGRYRRRLRPTGCCRGSEYFFILRPAAPLKYCRPICERRAWEETET